MSLEDQVATLLLVVTSRARNAVFFTITSIILGVSAKILVTNFTLFKVCIQEEISEFLRVIISLLNKVS